MCESNTCYNGKSTGMGESHWKTVSQATYTLCSDGQLQYTLESVPIKGCSKSYLTQQDVTKEMITQVSMSSTREKAYLAIQGNRQKIPFLTLSCTSQQVLAMGDKGAGNHSDVTDFILVGFRVRPEFHILLFLLFLLVYGMVLLGNISMMAIIVTDSQLNTPMYFFLGNLSFIDLSYSTVIAPKAMVNFLSEKKTVSFVGCATQFFLFAFFIVTEGFILAAMAYDRFIAICNPLLYSVHMSRRLCTQLVAGSYFCGWVSSILQVSITFSVSFCASRVIDHFYCDSYQIEKISCSNLFINKMVSLSLAAFIILPTIVVIVVSYMYIVTTVLKIPSSEGRKKAFSTCSSHLGVVSLLYGTVSFVYLTPPSNPELRKVASVFYILVTPMLNPLIYSLRNKDVKQALRKILWKKKPLS